MTLSFDPERAITVAETTVECLRQDFGVRLLRPSCRSDLALLADYMISAIDAYVQTEPDLLAQLDRLRTSTCGGGFQ